MIRVRFSCHGCGLTEIEVEVPARGNEDIITWIENTRPFITASHKKHSPHCTTQACDLMTTFSAGQRIGAPPATH